MLVDRAAQAAATLLRADGRNVVVQVVELQPLAVDIARSVATGYTNERVQAAIEQIAVADGLIVATPIYKAGMSGLFKSFVDLLDNDLLIAKPVLLGATAGTARHAMVVDEQLRPLFAFFRALTVPTSLFAATDDWGSAELAARIDRAAIEFAALVTSDVQRMITERSWGSYQHTFAGNATRAERGAEDVDLDTDLMRLARGDR